MARGKKAGEELTPEERLEQALVPGEEQPYPVPENWCWVRLGNLCTDIQYGYTAKAIFDNNYPKMLRITDIQDGEVDWDNVPNCDITENDFRKYELVSHDIVFARTGATTGKSYLVLEPPKSVYASYLIRIRLNSFFNRKYVYYMLQSEVYWKQIMELSSGIAQPGVNAAKLQSLLFPLSPLSEQQRIVNRIESLFAKLDEAKEKAQAVVDGFELRKSAILHKAFMGELARISAGRTIPLEAIVKTIRIGPFGSALHKEDYIIGGIPVINPKHIIHQQIVPDEKVTITEGKASELMPYRLRAGDIVVGRRGEMGRSAPVTKKEDGWLCGTGSLIIRLQEGYSGAFYSQIIASHSSVQYLEENCVGSTMKNLNEKIIKSLPVPNYTMEQQKTIVDILNHLLEKEQRAKEAAEAVLSQIDTMKKAILARAFRGALGTNDPAEEWAGELVKKMI